MNEVQIRKDMQPYSGMQQPDLLRSRALCFNESAWLPTTPRLFRLYKHHSKYFSINSERNHYERISDV